MPPRARYGRDPPVARRRCLIRQVLHTNAPFRSSDAPFDLAPTGPRLLPLSIEAPKLMAVRLMTLRDVPDDELDGILALLDKAEIAHYQTPPGLFGLSPAALWIQDPAQAPEARRLLAEFQERRASEARAAWESARAAGEVPSVWAALWQRPWHALGLFILVLGVLFALSLPMWGLGR